MSSISLENYYQW